MRPRPASTAAKGMSDEEAELPPANVAAIARMLLPDFDAAMARLKADAVATLDKARDLLTVSQRDPAWFAARRLRFTGSRFGTLAGNNPYSSPNSVYKDMLWPRPSFTNADMQVRDSCSPAPPCDPLMQRGIDLEPVCRDRYIAALPPGTRCDVPGLVVTTPDTDPDGIYRAFGYSPDGILCLPDGTLELLEIKCPRGFYSNSTRGSCTVQRIDEQGTVAIPHQYFDQIQGGAALLRQIHGEQHFGRLHFVQLVGDEMRSAVVAFDPEYAGRLMRGLAAQWEAQLLPRLLLQAAGHIRDGDVDPIVELDDGSGVRRDECGRVLHSMAKLPMR